MIVPCKVITNCDPKVLSLFDNFLVMAVDFVGDINWIAFPCYPQNNTLGRVKIQLPILLPSLKAVKVILQADASLT